MPQHRCQSLTAPSWSFVSAGGAPRGCVSSPKSPLQPPPHHSQAATSAALLAPAAARVPPHRRCHRCPRSGGWDSESPWVRSYSGHVSEPPPVPPCVILASARFPRETRLQLGLSFRTRGCARETWVCTGEVGVHGDVGGPHSPSRLLALASSVTLGAEHEASQTPEAGARAERSTHSWVPP